MLCVICDDVVSVKVSESEGKEVVGENEYVSAARRLLRA